jgi:hypothetical protein
VSQHAIVVTASDQAFAPFVEEALESLLQTRCSDIAGIGLLDLGLDAEQKSNFENRGVRVVKPDARVTAQHAPPIDTGQALACVARLDVRDYFPGFEVYVWFDADAWVQSPEFLGAFIAGARARGAAVARENGAGYRFSDIERRWWYGHMLALYGRLLGTYLCIRSSINIGVLALDAMAPHWLLWKKRVWEAIERMKSLDIEQHAFFATLHLDHLDVQFMPARFNWICTLSTPVWDADRGLFCVPGKRQDPISVLHLAGPAKTREYNVPTRAGAMVKTPLTLAGARRLRSSGPIAASPESANTPAFGLKI